MNRRRIVFVLRWLGLAATVWPCALSAAESGPPGVTVESVVAVARGLSPELATARLEADAASHKAGAAGVPDDPTVTFQAWDVNGRGVGQRWVGVEQQFRLWGKLDLERSAATAEAEAARHLAHAAESDLIARVKTVYAQYCATRRAVQLAAGLKVRVDESLALLRLKYGPTAVEQQDVVKADIEAATAATDVARREGEAKSAAARLNALIGRGAQAPLAAPLGFRALKSKLTLAGVQATARAANPTLAATEAQVRSAARTKELTDLNYYPDVTVGADFVQRPTGENSGQFRLGFKVPLQYEAKDAQQRAATSKLGAAQMRNDAIRIRLDGDVAEAWFALEAVRKAIRIFERRQLPPARLLVETARAGFEAGTTDLAALLDTERRLRSAELELLALRVEEQSRYAELERLAGGTL